MNSEEHKDPSTLPDPRRSWLWGRRLLPTFIAIVVAGVVGVATWGVTRFTKPPQLIGGVLNPPLLAYNFLLKDQSDQPISLESFRGKAVALTFLYTHCPDVCPLIADMMHKTYQKLGDTVKRVAFVAVSVDPRGDTPAAVRAFLATHHVENELTYLTGPFGQLRDVWAHYYVGSDAKEVNPEAVAVGPPSPDLVDHSAIVFIIDRRGEIRAFLPGNFDPEDLATNLRLLTAGKGK